MKENVLNDHSTVLGSIYLPSNPGTPVGRFDFLVDPFNGNGVEVGTPVAADTSEGTVVGAVVDMRTVGTANDPVAADLGGSYDSVAIAAVPEVMVASVQVFYSPSLRPVRAGLVRAATPEEMLKATGYYDIDWPIPAGVVPMVDGTFAKVCFDGKALLGPESQGLNVGGLSGQAAKSSYIGTLLRSAIHHGVPGQDSVAAIIFNVKGTDFIYLDEPPAPGYELSDEDKAIYEALGVPATPFPDVEVFAPAMPAGGSGTRSPRVDSQRLAWDLPMIWPYLRYFFPYLGDDEKWQSFEAEFRELKLNTANANERIDTFDKLEKWMDACIAQTAGDKEEGREPSTMAWRSHHVATFRRFKRMLTSLPARGQGLFTRSGAKIGDDVPVTGWTHGRVVVVDIAGMHTDVQAVVIARTVERLLRSAEDGELGVDHLMLVADELNAFAPSVGGEMAAVKKILQRVATQGRYAGISLFGAGQALSKVDDLIVSNAASSALGRTADAELASGVYGRMPAGLVERIATLPKGWMALKHYSFRSTLLVRFPRPAWRTGKAKTTGGVRPKAESVLGLSQRSLERAKEGVRPDIAETIIGSSSSAEEALDKLLQARTPDMKKVALHEPSGYDPENPFDFS
jgi:hypothetical protein